MEEQRDVNSTDSSEGESGSPSPSLPSPPTLPLQAAQQAHRTTNFFIDNILRPDFGCKKEHGPGARERAHTSGRERVHSLVSRPSLPGTPCQDSNCSSDSSSSSTSSSISLASPKKSNGGCEGATAAVSTGSSGVKAEERSGGATAENNSSSRVVLNGTGAPTPESQPLLWPAWVYCTRYSDRPSSGKAIVSRRTQRASGSTGDNYNTSSNSISYFGFLSQKTKRNCTQQFSFNTFIIFIIIINNIIIHIITFYFIRIMIIMIMIFVYCHTRARRLCLKFYIIYYMFSAIDKDLMQTNIKHKYD